MPGPRLVCLPGNETFARRLEACLDLPVTLAQVHEFPDGESVVRIEPAPAGDGVYLVATLHLPNTQLVPLLFSAALLREQGARRVILVAPYLAYMRQDRSFHPGEGVSARYFAELLSAHVDGLVTVDPHLHRIHALGEIFPVPAKVVHAAPGMGAWIRAQVDRPVLIGPDSESEQWVREVARIADAPYTVLSKIRRGDRDVEVRLPDTAPWSTRTPVLVDDMISTGATMQYVLRDLVSRDLAPPVCVAVHGVFAPGAYEKLLGAGAARVVTANTIPHESNAIDLGAEVATAARELMSG